MAAISSERYKERGQSHEFAEPTVRNPFGRAHRFDCGLDPEIVQTLNGVATPGSRTDDRCVPKGRQTRRHPAGETFIEPI